MSFDLFESALVSSLMYQWGFFDASRGRDIGATQILGNQQSPLDHILGDVVASVNGAVSGGRYFLLEMKRQRGQFKQEIVGKNAKPHRTALYDEIWKSPVIFDLARFGHFAGCKHRGKFEFKPYCYMMGVDPLTPSARLAQYAYDAAFATGSVPTNLKQVHALNHSRAATHFELFYDALNEPNTTLDGTFGVHTIQGTERKLVFSHGLGLNDSSFKLYLETLRSAMKDMNVDDNICVIGRLDPVTKAMTLISSDFKGIFNAFDALKKLHHRPKPIAPTAKMIRGS